MNRKLIYQGNILTLVTLDEKWEVAEHAPAVAILALKGDEVLGVEQFRPATGVSCWELPAGLIEAGETAEDAARRELAEETQLRGELAYLTRAYSSPGFTDELVHLFEASNLRTAHAEPDESEALTPGWHKVAERWEAIASGQVASSAPTVIGLSIAMQRLGHKL